MDLRKIKKLIELVEESKVVELEVTSGDESIRISMGSTVPTMVPPGEGTSHGSGLSRRADESSDKGITKDSDTGSTEKAPMAGVFYAAPNPDAEPFVAVGQAVTAGDVLCIIESMKMMNEITAKQSGTVSRIFVGNGDPVATGTPLFAIS